ncbi:hypothetical protein [Streptomyces nigra]|uniref:hypothetical protein n=1 Tax=Streptomyces nigra TaxID=1827580 RepID=UPI000F5134FB|nr:hypothetical protein [Streptomyces nigra]
MVALAGLMAAGCGPPDHPLIAVYSTQGGEVRVRLRPCPGSAVTSVKVIRLGGEPSGKAAPPGLDYWLGAPPKPMKGEQDLDLSSLPADWRARQKGTGGLTAGRYTLRFTSGHRNSVDYRGETTFRPADLNKLGPGEVLTGGKVMSLKEFRKKADESC